MTAEIDMSNDRANIAYCGEIPWHGLGQKVEDPNAPIGVWAEASGLTWEAVQKPIFLEGSASPIADMAAITRNDTGDVLSVMSSRYCLVQPASILELIDVARQRIGVTAEVMGSLHGGKRIWALCDSRNSFDVGNGDEIKRYLLVFTSYDGSLPTSARLTAIRVVCQNTLSAALREGTVLINQTHKSSIDVSSTLDDMDELAHAEVGSWEEFKDQLLVLGRKSLSPKQATDYFQSVLYPNFLLASNDREIQPELATRSKNKIDRLVELMETGPGANLPLARGTYWGAYNALTYYLDHEKARTVDANLQNAFWQAGSMKTRALQLALAA